MTKGSLLCISELRPLQSTYSFRGDKYTAVPRKLVTSLSRSESRQGQQVSLAFPVDNPVVPEISDSDKFVGTAK